LNFLLDCVYGFCFFPNVIERKFYYRKSYVAFFEPSAYTIVVITRKIDGNPVPLVIIDEKNLPVKLSFVNFTDGNPVPLVIIDEKNLSVTNNEIFC